MAEKCLMVATLAALVLHPSSTIRCFKPKSSPISKDRRSQPSSKLEEKGLWKEKKQLHCPSKSPLSRSCSWNKDNVIEPKPRPSSNLSCPNPKLENLHVVEVGEGESSFRVIESLFRSGWTKETRKKIRKILKVKHNEEVLNRFEEYRKLVKSKAEETTISSTWGGRGRVLVDGDEVLQFCCATITCSLGFNGASNICNKKSCRVCRILGYSFSAKVKPMLVSDNSREAHEMNKRESDEKVACYNNNAMMICRVIAGRIARYNEGEIENIEEGGEYDSVIVRTGDRFNGFQEIMVCNSSAILPCYVVIYKVS